ncbi:MAG TPA: gamma-glutamyl-gamma-aminobutyrate hydrolase family protein [Longimicrobium sp.]|nr:gamma-glutamyl-gamma-aminobutyrate hydrolase family protein [Longimicrobium sp.]
MADYRSRVLVLQHAEHEHLGRFVPALERRFVGYTNVRCDLGDVVPTALDAFDGLIVLGGPQSVYEEDRYPYLHTEKDLVRHALATNVPVFGICLGSQIIADVLGARVYPGRTFELGWKEVSLCPGIGDDKVVGVLPRNFTPLHWHGDVFDLPQDAIAIGSSALTQSQGFVWKRRAWGLLFHLEFTMEQLTAMAAEFPQDLRRANITPEDLLNGASEYLRALLQPSQQVFENWIDHLRVHC